MNTRGAIVVCVVVLALLVGSLVLRSAKAEVVRAQGDRAVLLAEGF